MLESVSESVHGIPGGPLGGLIEAYDGYRQRGITPAVHLGLPSPYMTVIISLDEPLELIRRVDPALGGARFQTLIGGLHSTPVLVAHDGAQSGIQLSVSPLASRALFGMPAAELAAADLEGSEVIGRAATELWERTVSTASWSERFATLDRSLADRMSVAGPVTWGSPAPVSAAWRLLIASGGCMPIAALAREVGWSQRQLEKRFRREIGMGPKQAARVIRFDRARRLLQAGALRARADQPRSGLVGTPLDQARIAADCGYHDQSHLIREFRAFTGLAPTAWLTQEFGNVQVSEPVGA